LKTGVVAVHAYVFDTTLEWMDTTLVYPTATYSPVSGPPKRNFEVAFRWREMYNCNLEVA
jgi:hypothetical protein